MAVAEEIIHHNTDIEGEITEIKNKCGTEDFTESGRIENILTVKISIVLTDINKPEGEREFFCEFFDSTGELLSEIDLDEQK